MIMAREELVRRILARKSSSGAGPSSPSFQRQTSEMLENLRCAVAERDSKLVKMERKVRLLRRRLKREKAEVKSAEGLTRAYRGSYEELMAQVTEARAFADVQIADAVADYKASAEFAAEVEEAGLAGYELGLCDGRKPNSAASPPAPPLAGMATEAGAVSPSRDTVIR